MLIALTSAVMHQGVHHEAGTCVDFEDAVAESLLSRGLAQLPIMQASAPPTPAVERDPIATAQLEEMGALNAADRDAPDKPSMMPKPHPRRR